MAKPADKERINKISTKKEKFSVGNYKTKKLEVVQGPDLYLPPYLPRNNMATRY